MGGGRGGPIRSTGAEGIEDSVVVTTLTVASHLKKKNNCHYYKSDPVLDGIFNWLPATRLEVVEFKAIGELIGWFKCSRHILPCSIVLEDNLVDKGWKWLRGKSQVAWLLPGQGETLYLEVTGWC